MACNELNGDLSGTMAKRVRVPKHEIELSVELKLGLRVLAKN